MLDLPQLVIKYEHLSQTAADIKETSAMRPPNKIHLTLVNGVNYHYGLGSINVSDRIKTRHKKNE